MYELVFLFLAWYFLIGNIFVQSWLIWGNFHTATDYQKFSLLGCDLKNVLQNTSQKCRSSRSQMLFKIGVLKLHAWRPASLLKKRSQHKCFPVNSTKSLRTAFFMEHLWILLLKIVEEIISNSTLERFVRERWTFELMNVL